MKKFWLLLIVLVLWLALLACDPDGTLTFVFTVSSQDYSECRSSGAAPKKDGSACEKWLYSQVDDSDNYILDLK